MKEVTGWNWSDGIDIKKGEFYWDYEEEVNCYTVYHTDSSFCHGCHSNENDAERQVNELNDQYGITL